ncbi:hypothetical protein WA026_017418 [Henosepilachna vigintioctopunctata]|uniref:Breast cancer type 2 susceptibility protein n=1 Tax=Henosepilachna vigintioctopunctata TaxID=420089 RepID=A0AAW1VHP4_9CUCU
MDNNQEFIDWTQPLSPVLNSSTNSNKSRKKLILDKKYVGKKLFETKDNTDKKIKTGIISSSFNTLPEKLDHKFDTFLSREVDIDTSSGVVTPTIGFVSASGKKLFSDTSSSDYANQLFVDIFDSTSSHKRKNKYNFLSNKISNILPENSEDEKFLGFQREEYISSLKKFENMQNLFNTLYYYVHSSDESDKKETHDKFNISTLNEKRKFEDFLHSNECDKKQKMLETNMKSQNNQSNREFHSDIGMSFTDNFKDMQEFSQKVNDLSSINALRAIGENQMNECQTTGKNEKICLQSEHLIKSENNYFQSNTDNTICSTFDTLKLADYERISSNVSRFQGDRNIDLKENNCSYVSNIPSVNSKKGNFECLSEYGNKSNPNSTFGNEQTNFDNVIQFSTASGKKIAISNAALSRAASVFKDTQDTVVCEVQSTCSKKENLPSAVESQHKNESEKPNFDMLKNTGNAEKRINFAEKTINTLPDSFFSNTAPSGNNFGFSTASGKCIEIPKASLVKINHLFKDITDNGDLTENIVSNSFSTVSNYSVSNEIAHDKSKLFIMKTDDSLNNSNFETKDNFSTPVRDIPKKRRLGSSVGKKGKFSDVALNRAKSLFGDMNFDDLKLPEHLKITSPSTSTPIRSSKTLLTTQYATNYMSTPTRQIQRSVVEKSDFFLSDFPQESNCPLLIQKPTTGDLKCWYDELQRQEILLEKRLTLISKKREVLAHQIHARSIQEGNKQSPSLPKTLKKLTLRDIQRLEMQSDSLEQVNNVILQINPQNAVLIHFNGKWLHSATVTTEDGCILVPTLQGLIGFSEIEPAFYTLPDIKKTLIPTGWVRNHYKWIIWKLASYERFFPSTLGGCFSVDNVIKQLKYRYYRELYCAERPALRKIYEMDDISQRRMILCISNIFKNGDNIELELTDGWYCIRTLIDEPLCHHVTTTKKIRIGSKLIMSGAELINCEGCYPLELEAQKVRLKIHFNSTRRAAWFSKLGYQKNSMPFLIKIDDAHPAGGVIGVIKIYIMRTYPLIYREKTYNSVVWRNQNAENKTIQEYENKYFKDYEDIDDMRISSKNNVITSRNVCPIFQMTVIDVLNKKPKPYKFTVWDANEFHIQQLRENQCMLIYNISLRSTDELCSNKRTRFELAKDDNPAEYIKYKRKYVAIASYDVMLCNSCFGLFDTMGFVVETFVGEENQYFWLTGINKSLLLIEINEGPKRCLLLNKIQKDQPAVVCNLSLKDSCEGYVRATATLNTVVTQYPQYEYLRKELDELKGINKTELDILLKNVKMMLGVLQEKNTSKHTLHSSTDSATLNFSRVTSTDIVMSMINIDNVVNNVK